MDLYFVSTAFDKDLKHQNR